MRSGPETRKSWKYEIVETDVELPIQGQVVIRKGFQRTYDLTTLPTPADMERIAAPWRPYRSIGTWYMWQAVDTKPKS